MCVGFRPIPVTAVVNSNQVQLKNEAMKTSSAMDGSNNKKQSGSIMMMSTELDHAFAISRKRSLSEIHSVSDSDSEGSTSPLNCPFDESTSSTNNINQDNRSGSNNKRFKPSNKGGTNNKRSVRFGENQSFASSSTHPVISDEGRRELWYGLDDCASFNASSSQTIRDFRDQNLDSVRHVLCVASQCTHSPPPRAYLNTVRLRLPDEIRGLEMAMLPLRVRQSRQHHVKRVVGDIQQLVSLNKLQTICVSRRGESRNPNRDGGGGSSSSRMRESKDEIIASHARRSSQASRVFAELLAREVAEDVAAFMKEETTTTTIP
jgi:hypothetical protein